MNNQINDNDNDNIPHRNELETTCWDARTVTSLWSCPAILKRVVSVCAEGTFLLTVLLVSTTFQLTHEGFSNLSDSRYIWPRLNAKQANFH